MIKTMTIQCKNQQRLPGKIRLIGIALVSMLALLIGCGSSGSDSGDGSGSSTGQAGSQARFTIAGNYLYTVNRSDMQVFDITTSSNPVPWSGQSIGFGIETIFSHDQYLFIGSQNGIFIYDISNPQFPAKVSSLLHARSCDPVVVEGNYAYVTLRSGSACFGTSNQLDIISIATVTQPVLVKSYAMQQPSGLGVDNGKVFICDGIAGLKVLNVSDPLNILSLDRVDGQNCFDVIPVANRLVVSGSNGLYQYDYTAFPMTELSRL